MNMAEFCFGRSLYDVINIDINSEDDYDNFYLWKGKFDCYCPECRDKTIVYSVESIQESYKNHIWVKGVPRYLTAVFHCARDASHKMVFYMIHDGDQLFKIGQFPSVADLQFGELNKFRSILDGDETGEFYKAIGLSAHDVGIGAFVYLRRVLEKLVDKRGKQAISDGVFSQMDFQKARVAEKIKMLKGYLPDILVSNTKLYGVLSKGVHELTEQECLKSFPAIRDLMFFVLEEDLERNEKAKLLKAAEDAIKSL